MYPCVTYTPLSNYILSVTTMQCSLQSAKQLKRIIDGVGGLVAQANIDCNEQGIDMQAMDSSHVALCSLKLHASGFDEYQCSAPLTVGINVGHLSKVLKCAENNDGAGLSTDGDSEMDIKFQNKCNLRSSQFTLRLIELDVDTLVIPDITYDCVVDMPSSEFQRIVRELTALGEGELGADTLMITGDENGVTFSIEGDGGDGRFHFANGTSDDVPMTADGDSTRLDVTSPCKSQFGMRYLATFAKAAVGPRVVLSMSTEAPMRVEYPIDGLGYLRFYLAPKLDGIE